jgi:homoprotocatechuate degradation regulator HpaR
MGNSQATSTAIATLQPVKPHAMKPKAPAARKAPTPRTPRAVKPAAVPAAGPAMPLAEPPGAASAHRNLPLLLLQAREAVIANFRPILNSHGLTEQQWRVLRALRDAGPLEPRQIVGLCRISSPSLAGVLARMDELGLVRRERMAGDARRVRVSLTASSVALAARMAPLIEATYAGIEARIGASFIGRFYDTLDELITLLGAPEAADD